MRGVKVISKQLLPSQANLVNQLKTKLTNQPRQNQVKLS